MYNIEYDSGFKSDYKKCLKRKLNISLLNDVIYLLEQEGKLPAKYKTHLLKGNYKGFSECHIEKDWLLIWFQDDETKTIIIARTGKHDDLF